MTREKFVSKMSLDSQTSKTNRGAWSRKNEEYAADFCLVAKRNLTESEYRILRYHFLLGADWKLCCEKLKVDRGTFFHMVYRIQQKLGRVYRELEPYPLFPVDEYFNGPLKQSKSCLIEERVVPIRPPVRSAEGLPSRQTA